MPLPFIRDFAHAEALYLAQNDPFYLDAFLIQSWLGGLLQHAAAEYAEKKNPKDRRLQSGEAWSQLQGIFPRLIEEESDHLVSSLRRFSNAEESSGGPLCRALALFSIEQQCPIKDAGSSPT